MSLRARLVIGYAFLFCLALVVLGGVLYQVLRGALSDEVDRALRERAMQIERAARSSGADLNSTQLRADLAVLTAASAGMELHTPGIMTHVFDLDGQTIAFSSELARELPHDPAVLTRVAGGDSVLLTAHVEGAPVRVLYHPLRLSGNVVAIIEVGESLSPMEQ